MLRRGGRIDGAFEEVYVGPDETAWTLFSMSRSAFDRRARMVGFLLGFYAGAAFALAAAFAAARSLMG